MPPRPVRSFKAVPFEPRAKALLARAVPGAAFVDRDVPPEQGRHDFDLILPGGRRAAVEVTSTTDPLVMNALRTLRDPRGPIANQTIPASGRLQQTWSVMPTERTPLKLLAAELIDLLATIEAEFADNLAEPLFRSADWSDSEARRRLHEDLQVEAAFPYPGPPAGKPVKVHICSPQQHRVWSSSPDDPGNHVIKAAEDHARRQDNLRKLTAADAPERHLFLWVDAFSSLEWSDIVHEMLPSRPPELPEVIDVLWVGTEGPDDLLWRYDHQHGWQSVIRGK